MPHKTILVTGASRGLGHTIAALLLQRPDTIVIATFRDSKTQTELLKALTALPVHSTSRLITADIDSASDTSAAAAISGLKSEHGITNLDIVIAAAGTVTAMDTVAKTTPADVLEHVDVNAAGVLRLWQVVSRLLLKSTTSDNTTPSSEASTPNPPQDPIFLALSSSCGSIAETEPVPGLAYGMSKAALNYLVRKIHQEHGESVCAVAVHPGWVRTRMGEFAADAWGAGVRPPLSVEESAGGVVGLMDGMTRSSAGGRFLCHDGSELKW